MPESPNIRPVVNVLFICLGNICRSPTSEGVFQKLVDAHQLPIDFKVDSAGTANYHVGHPPDRRATAAASKRGVHIEQLRARRVHPNDIEIFDYIIAMDRMNYEDLKHIAPRDSHYKIRMFMEFATEWSNEEVPDPYYGGDRGFEDVLDMIEDASQGLLNEIKDNYQAS